MDVLKPASEILCFLLTVKHISRSTGRFNLLRDDQLVTLLALIAKFPGNLSISLKT